MAGKNLVLTDLEAFVFNDFLDKGLAHNPHEEDLKKVKGGFSLSDIWECLFAVPTPRYEFIDGKFVDVNPCSINNRKER